MLGFFGVFFFYHCRKKTSLTNWYICIKILFQVFKIITQTIWIFKPNDFGVGWGFFCGRGVVISQYDPSSTLGPKYRNKPVGLNKPKFDLLTPPSSVQGFYQFSICLSNEVSAQDFLNLCFSLGTCLSNQSKNYW